MNMDGRRENTINRISVVKNSCNSVEGELRNCRQYSNRDFGNEGREEDGIALYIKYVPSSYTPESFEVLLSKFGKIISVYIGKPSQKFLASKLVFSIVKVATMRDAMNIMENVHRKPPLNLSVEFAKSLEDRKTTNLSKPSSTHTLAVQGSHNYENSNMRRQNGFLSTQSNLIKPKHSEETSLCPQSTDTEPSEEVVNGFIGHQSLPRMNSCLKCKLIGSKRCSVCKGWYCSKTCQYDDWYYHQQICRPPPPLEEVNDLDYCQSSSVENGEIVPPATNSVNEKYTLQIDQVDEKEQMEDNFNDADVTSRENYYSFSQLMNKTTNHNSSQSKNEDKLSRHSRNAYLNSSNESMTRCYKSCNQTEIPSRQALGDRTKFPPKPVQKENDVPSRRSLLTDRKKHSQQVIEFKSLISYPVNIEERSQESTKKYLMFSRDSLDKDPLHVADESNITSQFPSWDEGKEFPVDVLVKEESQKGSDALNKRRTFMKGELFTQSIEVDVKYVVLPTWYEDGTLYVHLFSDAIRELAEDVTAELLKHCSSASVPASMVKGEIICAFIPEDEIWYRGEVMEVDGGNVLVHFIDFGNTGSIPMSNIRLCDSRFMQTPIMAIPVKPICEVSNDDVVEPLLTPLINECAPILMEVKRTSPCVEVELWDVEEKSKILSQIQTTNTNTKTDAQTIESNATENTIENNTSLKLLKSDDVKPTLMMYDECKSTSLPLQNNVDVVILQPTNPLCCFLTPKESIHLYEELEDLSVQMNDYCNSLDTNYYEPKEEEVCLAKFSKDGIWYRACCMTLDEKSAELIFVDYGNQETVFFKDICQMVDKFLKIPLIALHSQVQGFSLEEIKIGGSRLGKTFQKALSPYSTHTVNVLSRCQDSNVYKIEIPTLAVEDIKKEAFF